MSLLCILLLHCIPSVYSCNDFTSLIKLLNSVTDLSLNSLLILIMCFVIYYLTLTELLSFTLIIVLLCLVTISYYSSVTLKPWFTLNDTLMYINLDLFNGMLSIHPPILLMSYSFLLSILFITFSVNLHYNISLKKKKNDTMLSIASLSSLNSNLNVASDKALSTIFIAILLGSYWAHQELSWGGYWSWDPIEMLSLMASLSALYLSHLLSTKPSYFKFIIIAIPAILSILLVRANSIPSVHGFLDIQDLRFNTSNLIVMILPFSTLLLSLMLLLKSDHSNSKSDLLKVVIMKLTLSLLVISVLFMFLFFLVYLFNALIISSTKPVKIAIIPSLSIFFLTILFLDKYSVFLAYLLPFESLLLHLSLINKKKKFKLGTIHALIIPIFFFFFILSHTYFVDTLRSKPDSIYYDYVYTFKTSTLGFQILQTLSNYNLFLELTDSYLFNLNNPLSYNIQPSLNALSEQFNLNFILGLDSINYGYNLLRKLTYTYPLFIVSALLVPAYTVRNRVAYLYTF